MIYAPLTAFSRSAEMPLVDGAVITADGQAMVHRIVNNKPGIAPSAGTAGEKFAGFLRMQTSAAAVIPSTMSKVEERVVPADGVISVDRTVLANSAAVFNAATGAAIAVTATSGNTVSVANTNATTAVRVVYRYALSATEARALVGDVQPGGFVGNTVRQAGVGQEGVVYTSQFDTSADWAAAAAIRLGANGQIVASGTGAIIKAVVAQLPSIDYPFLGLRFEAEA